MKLIRIIRRMPATLVTVGAVLAVGVVFRGLWRPFERSPLFDVVAYGLPALEQGRWWTPVTGTFFVARPGTYLLVLTMFVGMAYLEYRRGWRLALGYFWVGQLFAVLGSALLLAVLSNLPWDWAQTEAASLDVGPSGGAMACLAAAIGLLVQPWRVRAWLLLLSIVFITLFFWGSLDDLEHALAVVLVLFVDRSLRVQRTTVREQRLLAFVLVLVLGAIQIITLLTPTDGPFGKTAASAGSWIDVAIDTVVIVVFANGIRRGRRWAWIVTLVYSVLNVLVGVAIGVLVAAGYGDEVTSSYGDVGMGLAAATIWLLLLIYLIWVRRAFRTTRRSRIGLSPVPTAADAAHMLKTYGGGTLSWMTTWDNLSYARTTRGMVAYQRRSGVALALGDPLGPEDTRGESVREFIDAAEHAGLAPCFFSASEAARAAVPDGWRSLVVADDTIVDLPGLAFTGKSWGSVRTALNRAGREKITFRLTHLKDEPWGVRQQLRAISEMWVGDRGLPEMGFTLGSLDQAEAPEVRLAIAVSDDGDVDGFLSWLPIYGPDGAVDGWTLDLMRRRVGGFGPVMEFLIGSSAKQFSEEGARIMSLSGAPLAHDYPPDAGVIADLSDRLAESLEPVYGFRSLHKFKDKFNPRYETMYLLYRDESDLVNIAAALTRAFLPDATLRQFAGAGIEMLRGEKDDAPSESQRPAATA